MLVSVPVHCRNQSILVRVRYVMGCSYASSSMSPLSSALSKYFLSYGTPYVGVNQFAQFFFTRVADVIVHKNPLVIF